jgi:hypothetical protein
MASPTRRVEGDPWDRGAFGLPVTSYDRAQALFTATNYIRTEQAPLIKTLVSNFTFEADGPIRPVP